MDEQQTGHSPILWVIVSGIVFVLSACCFTFVALHPEVLSSLFEKSGGGTGAIPPVSPSNGNQASKEERTAAPHTRHYSNAFLSFDYPESFTVTGERVDQEADGTSVYGATEVTLVASTSDEQYVIRVVSSPLLADISPKSVIENAEDAFMARAERGPNDSIQEITVDGGAAYKDYSDGRIHIGIPKGKMRYDASIEWNEGRGTKGTANFYLGNIEDSFSGL